jgi:ABC-type proline/glycine betaine transport system ATPase subunit
VREAMRLGTRIALLHKGKLAFLGAPADFHKSTDPEAKAFLEVLNVA